MNETVAQLKAALKLLLFFLLLVFSIWKLYMHLMFTSKHFRQKVKFQARQQFCKNVNTIFGVELVIVGELPPDGCYLYISNHRSFYDPVALLSRMVANPVSKAEVSRYPVIGWGTRLTEVVMVNRSEKEDRKRTKHQIYESLLAGTSIVVYPEGTTTSANHTAHFMKGAFDSAARAERAVIPVAMEYPGSNYYWINRSLYAQFVFQMVKRKDNAVYMSIGKPIFDSDPSDLLIKTKDSIEDQIVNLRQLRSKRHG